MKSEINRKDIVLGDYSWLGFGSDPRSAIYRRTRDVDMLKKSPLRPRAPPGSAGAAAGGQTQKRRRCVRCCEVSGDTSLPRSIAYFKMVAKLNLLRCCPCGGLWMLESENGTTLGSGSAAQQEQKQQQQAVRTPAAVAVV